MKRLPVALLSVLSVLVLGVGVAQAVPGPEPGSPDFDIIVEETQGAPEPHDQYSLTTYDTADGWDFGDRAGYRCAWVEFFQAGAELMQVHYELVAGYSVPIRINDRFGEEGSEQENADLCGDGIGGDQGDTVFDGSDHFPHGTALTFSQNGVQIAEVDYALKEPGGCDKGYWTPGDEPGEAWLWWDDDGPQETMPGMGDCAGGSGEPSPVARAYVKNLAPGISVCTEDALNGDICLGDPTPLPGATHASAVTLNLKGKIRAFGSVTIPDGTGTCKKDRVVLIQRSVSGDWKRVGQDRTGDNGHYSLHIPDRQGAYRARVTKATLASGDVCKADTSKKRLHDIGPA
jgi:hypothetical protein